MSWPRWPEARSEFEISPAPKTVGCRGLGGPPAPKDDSAGPLPSNPLVETSATSHAVVTAIRNRRDPPS